MYRDDHGLLTVDLSGSFRQGFRGGATAEYLAIASLVRTLAANLPEVERVLVVCAGRPIATLGGHLPLDRPLDDRARARVAQVERDVRGVALSAAPDHVVALNVVAGPDAPVAEDAGVVVDRDNRVGQVCAPA